MEISYRVIAVAALLVGLAIGYILRKIMAGKALISAEKRAKELIEEAKKNVEAKKKEVELEAKDLLYRTRADFEKESKDRRQELLNIEKRLLQKEENLDRKVDILDKKEKDILHREKSILSREGNIEHKERELDNLVSEEKVRLQKIAGLSVEDARKLLLERMQNEVQQEANIMIKRIEDETKELAEKKAKNIISLAIQRYAGEHVLESTVSVVNLPNDEMKGRIIGREGRNIRALEAATGIEVIIDDTPEAVILSGFDMVRREVAKITLERLIADGRIHPARIEEIVEKVKGEIEDSIREEGEKAAFDVGVHGIHPEIIKLIGRLKYRTSYGQNVLQHSKEVAFLMGVMASELGIDPVIAKRIGLLHDIGKAVSHEVEGGHATIGADLAKRYGELPVVLHPIEAHNLDTEPKTILAVLANAADAVSAARPGARRETLESYVKRLKKLEGIADSFRGVEKSYAIQAGREIRVMVQPDKISDVEAVAVARQITKKIESELEYPGQIKVTVIRETRAIEYAK